MRGRGVKKVAGRRGSGGEIEGKRRRGREERNRWWKNKERGRLVRGD